MVYDPIGIAPCLCVGNHSGVEPKIIEIEHYEQDNRRKETGEEDSAKGWRQRKMSMKLKIPQATKKGYIEVAPNGCFDWTYPNSLTRRGRVQMGGVISPTILCQNEILVYEGVLRPVKEQGQERLNNDINN